MCHSGNVSAVTIVPAAATGITAIGVGLYVGDLCMVCPDSDLWSTSRSYVDAASSPTGSSTGTSVSSHADDLGGFVRCWVRRAVVPVPT